MKVLITAVAAWLFAGMCFAVSADECTEEDPCSGNLYVYETVVISGTNYTGNAMNDYWWWDLINIAVGNYEVSCLPGGEATPAWTAANLASCTSDAYNALEGRWFAQFLVRWGVTTLETQCAAVIGQQAVGAGNAQHPPAQAC